MKKNNKKGFTLIELLIVIAIIGLLSTLAVAALGPARAKARDARRISNVKAIQKALEMAKDANGGIVTTSTIASYIQGGVPMDTSYPYYICISIHKPILNKYLVYVKLESSNQRGVITKSPDWVNAPEKLCYNTRDKNYQLVSFDELKFDCSKSREYCVGDGD